LPPISVINQESLEPKLLLSAHTPLVNAVFVAKMRSLFAARLRSRPGWLVHAF
jgi:hypothetical protein